MKNELERQIEYSDEVEFLAEVMHSKCYLCSSPLRTEMERLDELCHTCVREGTGG